MTLKDCITMDTVAVITNSNEPDLSEREEGEISDLDLEDVSDCSFSSNKSTSIRFSKNGNVKREHDALYFSCVSESDSDYRYNCGYCQKYNCNGCDYSYIDKDEDDGGGSSRSHRRRKRERKYKHKSRRKSHDSVQLVDDWNYTTNDRLVGSPSIISSDSEPDLVNRSLLMKLNKAVHVNQSKSDQFQTSLRTRLNNMVNNDVSRSNSDSECELMELRKLALESKLRENDKIEKNETAVENHKSEDVNEDEEEEETDKEAQQLRINALRSAIIKKHELRRKRQNDEPKPINSGSDALNQNIVQIKTVINDLLDYIITDNNSSDCGSVVGEPNVESQISEDKNAINTQPSETTDIVDEDEDILRAMLLTSIAKRISEKSLPEPLPLPPKLADNQRIVQKNIDIPVQRLIINLGADSDSDSDVDNQPAAPPPSTATIPAQFTASLNQLLKEARENVEKQQKSSAAVQHLPKSRQVEYIKLKKRLDQLTKTHQLRKNVTTTFQKNTSKSETLQKVPLKVPRINRKLSQFTTNQINTVKPKSAPAALSDIKRKPLNQLPKQNISNVLNNQKRMLEGRYKDLVPIVKKTKAARVARDKAGEDVTRLIDELKVARVRYNECHQTYKNCIQEYLMLKSKLEVENAVDSKKRIRDDYQQQTSTLNKKRPKLQENIQIKANLNNTSTTTIGKISDTKLNTIEPETSLPTNNSENNRQTIDANPLIEICPYDLQGSCRDVDCKYRHLNLLVESNKK